MLPIASIWDDLVATLAGIKYKSGSFFPQYVMLLCEITKPPVHQEIGTGSHAQVELLFEGVRSVLDAGNHGKTISVEVLLTKERTRGIRGSEGIRGQEERKTVAGPLEGSADFASPQ